MQTMIQEIAAKLGSMYSSGNILSELERRLPSGAGIDNGTKIDVSKCKRNKIVLTCGYHNMNENGFYDGGN